jgi:hypothetical protein
MDGPGCIWRIWSALAENGHVKIYLDGSDEPVVDLPFKNYFSGDAAPFDFSALSYNLADDGCRRFHVDHTRLRLLCTYRGPGTEWLAHDQVDRQALAAHQPNDAILRHGQPRHLEPFWVGVLKGERFPGNAGRGLVHRSPPVADTGTTRVLVCLDA